jgi:hypothetical protein
LFLYFKLFYIHLICLDISVMVEAMLMWQPVLFVGFTVQVNAPPLSSSAAVAVRSRNWASFVRREPFWIICMLAAP